MDFACLNVVLPCMLSYIKDLIGQKKKKRKIQLVKCGSHAPVPWFEKTE